jgi:transposase
MDVVHPRCCGLDVHKKTVVACVLTPGATSRPVKQVRTFGTMTDELLGLADWLDAQSVTHVAMEATGAYWKPPWNLLEDQFELLLVNARHVKAVPGRKTDVKDAEWLAELLRHGLLRPSFVPDRAQRELRELTRYRTALVQAPPRRGQVRGSPRAGTATASPRARALPPSPSGSSRRAAHRSPLRWESRS